METKPLTDKDFESLPFSQDVQEALLGHVLQTPAFFSQIRNYLESKWFANLYHQKIYQYLVDYHKKYNQFPKSEDLILYISLQPEDPADKQRMANIVRASIIRAQGMQTKQLADHLTTWLKSRLYFFGLSESQKLYSNKKFGEAFDRTIKCARDLSAATINEHEPLTWTDPSSIFQAQDLDKAHGLTFGLKMMDDILLEGNVCGGLLPGDTTVLLAPLNVGKTSAMITVAAANVLQQKHVLFLFHEGRKSDLQLKVLQNIFGCSQLELPHYYRAQPQIADRLVQIVNKHLVMVPVFKPGLTVEEVEGVITRLTEEHRDRYGCGFDLIVDDYPAKLTTAAAKNGGFAWRNMQQYVYNYFVQIALQQHCHVLCAIQTNREGSKINRQTKDAGDYRLLTVEDVNESFGPMQDVANVISINRSPLADLKQRLTYLVCKSRTSRTNIAVVCKTNYSHCITHSNGLGACFYHGTAPMEDRIDGLLAQYHGGAIPPDRVVSA